MCGDSYAKLWSRITQGYIVNEGCLLWRLKLMAVSIFLEFSPQKPITLTIRPTVPHEREISIHAIIMNRGIT
jgi:hypothetical protein